jgi:hypothetical protein
MPLHHLAKLTCFGVFIGAASLAPSAHALAPPVGDGTTDDTDAINAALHAAAGSCGTVQLQCTSGNRYIVSNTIKVPACVKLVGACGAAPGEGPPNTAVGTTLVWPPPPIPPALPPPPPVVAFHDSPGASLSGVSIDCQNASNSIGIQYDSDDVPSASFVNIDTLMIKGCHQALVVGLADNAAITCPSPLPTPPNPVPSGCAQSDQLKFERFRILGNAVPNGAEEGIHINSANAAQGSLIFNGNMQGVNIGIHVISTNGGLIVENTNYGAVDAASSFLTIEPAVAVSPTLINDEVEGPGASVIDHGCNGTPGNPVWLNNAWNDHPVMVDGNESITSIGSVLNKATLSSSTSCATATPNTPTPHVVSINENGWTTSGTVTSANLTMIGAGIATFGPSLIDQDVVEAAGPACLSVPTGSPPGSKPGYFPINVLQGDLVACEGPHAGQLWLGKDLMLLNSGAGANGGTLKIQAGLDPDGSGLKHQAVSVGPILAGRAAIVVLNWTTPFPDTNYQAVCSVQDNSGSLQLVSTSTPAPDHLNTEVKNNGVNASSGSLNCFAIHN